MKKILIFLLLCCSQIGNSQTSLAIEANTRALDANDFVLDFHQNLSPRFRISSWNNYSTQGQTESFFTNMFLSLNYLNYHLTDNLHVSVGYRIEKNLTYDFLVHGYVAKIRWKIL